jgi:hypothetical protein
VTDLFDGSEVIGFEVSQDFRMSQWGLICNYRYGQRFQFFVDGSIRVAGAAYGKGCGNDTLYRSLLRLDLAVAGDAGDSFAAWDGGAWVTQTTEAWWSQSPPYAEGAYQWRVADAAGRAYHIEPGFGQFDDGGRGDDAYLFVVQHDAAEGDLDLSVVGDCCHDDEQQGPDLYVDGESIADTNLVLWYVPTQQTVVDSIPPADYFCWTVSGLPNPETYPCWAGPRLVPNFGYAFAQNKLAVLPGETVLFTATASAGSPAFAWDFGDSLGSASVPNPAYSYTAPGLYSVTLTILDAFGTVSETRGIWVGYPVVADFQTSLANPVVNLQQFTSLTTGTPPFQYLWDFGDGVTSTAASPTHIYPAPGPYTVTLTAANPLTSSAVSRVVISPWRSLLLVFFK